MRYNKILRTIFASTFVAICLFALFACTDYAEKMKDMSSLATSEDTSGEWCYNEYTGDYYCSEKPYYCYDSEHEGEYRSNDRECYYHNKDRDSICVDKFDNTYTCMNGTYHCYDDNNNEVDCKSDDAYRCEDLSRNTIECSSVPVEQDSLFLLVKYYESNPDSCKGEKCKKLEDELGNHAICLDNVCLTTSSATRLCGDGGTCVILKYGKGCSFTEYQYSFYPDEVSYIEKQEKQCFSSNGFCIDKSCKLTEYTQSKDASVYDEEKNTLLDTRDSNTYKTVKIKDQVWMAENLKYKQKTCRYYNETYSCEESYCYNDKEENCKTLGQLYYNPVASLCPSGWHIPSNYEWQHLNENINFDAKQLKATTSWSGNGNGTNKTGFNVFSLGGYNAHFWSEEQDRWCISYDEDSLTTDNCYGGEDGYHSIRCIKDGSATTIINYSSKYYGSMTDNRDGQVYRTVQRQGETWLAENLRYKAPGSKCYNNSDSLCNIFGRLYQWTTAMNLEDSYASNYASDKIKAVHQGICPEGWHVPKQYDFYPAQSGEGYSIQNNIKNDILETGWIGIRGTSSYYNLSLLPAGSCKFATSSESIQNFECSDIGFYTYLITSDEDSWTTAYGTSISKNHSENNYSFPKTNYGSLRCIKDNPNQIDFTYGTVTDPRDGKKYKTKTSKGITWMVEDLQYYTQEKVDNGSVNIYSFSYTDVDDLMDYSGAKCNDDDIGDCGCFSEEIAICKAANYTWYYDHGCGSSGFCAKVDTTIVPTTYKWDAAMNIEDGNYETISFPSKNVQGICMDGWHIMSSDDFKELESYTLSYSIDYFSFIEVTSEEKDFHCYYEENANHGTNCYYDKWDSGSRNDITQYPYWMAKNDASYAATFDTTSYGAFYFYKNSYQSVRCVKD